MEEIRRTKIKEAMKETLNVYEKLDLNMTEIEIVSRSQNVAAKVTIAKKQLETEAGDEILAKMTPPYNLTGKDFGKVGITFTSSGNGYQKGTKSSRFGRIANSIGGSSSTYTCDYFWWNAGITAVALVGGNCNDGEYCGADYLNLNGSAGYASWDFGASVFLEQPIAA